MNYYFIDYENTGEAGLSGIKKLDENNTVIIFYSQNNGKISFDMHKTLCSATAKLEYHRVNTATKNALDFQLSSYLGYLISQNGDDAFYIISKDNGYHAVLSFWQGKNVQQVYTIAAAIALQQPAEEAPRTEVLESQPSAEEAPQPEERTAGQPAEPEAQPAEEQPEPEKPKKVTKVVAKKQPAKKKKQAQPREKPEEPATEPDLKTKVQQLIAEKDIAENVARFVGHYKTKLGVNNAIVKAYGSEKAGEIYKKIKPLLKDKKGN